jgi:hypothetical protein
MLSARLIQLIETHSEALTREVLQDLATNPKTRSFQMVPRAELESRTGSRTEISAGGLAIPATTQYRRNMRDWGRRRFARESR